MQPPFHCDEKGLRSGPDAPKQENRRATGNGTLPPARPYVQLFIAPRRPAIVPVAHAFGLALRSGLLSSSMVAIEIADAPGNGARMRVCVPGNDVSRSMRVASRATMGLGQERYRATWAASV